MCLCDTGRVCMHSSLILGMCACVPICRSCVAHLCACVIVRCVCMHIHVLVGVLVCWFPHGKAPQTGLHNRYSASQPLRSEAWEEDANRLTPLHCVGGGWAKLCSGPPAAHISNCLPSCCSMNCKTLWPLYPFLCGISLERLPVSVSSLHIRI